MLFGLRNAVPNRIDTIAIPGYVGVLGLVACPGVRVEASSAGNRRNIQADMQEIVDWGANRVVSLMEPYELKLNKIEDLPELAAAASMEWVNLSIVDMQIPDQAFEDRWAEEGEIIRHSLRIGERVILHCYAGLGRTGMIAARLLVEMGMGHDEAIKSVRVANRRRIQTKDQSAFVRTCYELD